MATLARVSHRWSGWPRPRPRAWRALLRKRAGSAARELPLLAAALGERWYPTFAELRAGSEPVGGLRVAFTGQRAQSDPHRFTAIRLEFTIAGPVAETHVDRAVGLSRDKYCSVWNSLRDDIALEIVTRIEADSAR